MTQTNSNHGESVGSVLIATNFFLWTVAFELTDAINLFQIFFFITLFSLGVIIFSKQETEIILRKFGAFFIVNLLGSIVLITNMDHRYEIEGEAEAITFYTFLQSFIIIIITALLIINKYLNRNKKPDPKKQI